MSLLPDEAPIEPLLDEELGDDVVDELVSVLLLPVVLEDGEVEEEPLDEPVPDAPIDDELLLGELDELVDGEAPIVDDDDLSVELVDGVLPAVLLLELGVLELLPAVLGVLLLVPVLLPLVEPELVPAPAEVPELPVPELWAMARPPKARAAAAARVVRVVLVALILNSLMELPARERGGTEAGTAAGWTED
ncbi:hypothetical protein ACPWT1_10775 [Ramlibacter sp. MMS24-I3-19]|uniref:hypothetical protein n=1 Tax=Ramlibacter sp. MMS24-I3-19 TaxID=3416606 RepID=UPI003D011943